MYIYTYYREIHAKKKTHSQPTASITLLHQAARAGLARGGSGPQRRARSWTFDGRHMWLGKEGWHESQAYLLKRLKYHEASSLILFCGTLAHWHMATWPRGHMIHVAGDEVDIIYNFAYTLKTDVKPKNEGLEDAFSSSTKGHVQVRGGVVRAFQRDMMKWKWSSRAIGGGPVTVTLIT